MKKILLLVATTFCFTNLINAQAGQLDSSFGTDGIVTADLGQSYSPGSPAVTQVLLQSDGSIYDLHGSLTKRHADGSVDSSYGLNGVAESLGFEVNKAAIGPDGKIVVAGYNTDGSYLYVIARYDTNGRLDRREQTDLSNIYSIAIQPDGKIVFSGYQYDVNYNRKYLIERYDADGSADETFIYNRLTNRVFYPNSIALQSNGKILVAGTDASSFVVARYNINGSLDNTFSNDGIQTTSFGAGHDTVTAVAIQSDGKIVVAGNTDGHLALIRYKTDGSLDNSFSGDGKLTQDQIYANSLAIQTNNKIVVAGGKNKDFAVLRYNSDGSLDNTFSSDGIQTTDFSSSFDIVQTVGIQKDGKMVVGGSSDDYLALTRYNSNGSLDDTFNKNGKVTDFYHGYNTGFNSIATNDKKVVAVGSKWKESNFYSEIASYNIKGRPDSTFGNNGIQTSGFGSQHNVLRTVRIQKDGKIIVAGGYAIARYNTDGSLDKTFSANEKQTPDSIYIYSAIIQNDGKIVAAGSKDFKGNDGNYTYPAVIRYNPDGSLDNSFGVNGKQIIVLSSDYYSDYTSSSSILIQKDGKIVVAGILRHTYEQFGMTVRVPYGVIILRRLNTDGSPDNTFNRNATIEEGASSFAITSQDNEKILFAESYGPYNQLILGRFNNDGSIDSSFNGHHFGKDDGFNVSSIIRQDDGKIIVAGSGLIRFNTNGKIDNTFGRISTTFFINDIAVLNNKLYAVGKLYAGGFRYGTLARYLLDNSNTPAAVTLTAPKNNATYLAPAAHIRFFAVAADKDGTISKVEFYNGTTLLHTETVFPYGFAWRNVGLGNYTLTAKAYDNSGNVTTSAPVHISVVPNKPPVVSITKPVNNRSFAAPGYIHLEAAASDTDGRVTNVKFYNGTTLLRTEYEYPYTYHWENVPAGTYTITAVATDNWGAHTTSAPVTIIVKLVNTMMVSNKPINNKTVINDKISLKLSPNPATNIVNINTNGLQQSKPATISIIGVSGIVLKTMQTHNSTTQLDVSSLAKGVYTIKIVSGDKVMFKQFVKS